MLKATGPNRAGVVQPQCGLQMEVRRIPASIGARNPVRVLDRNAPRSQVGLSKLRGCIMSFCSEPGDASNGEIRRFEAPP